MVRKKAKKENILTTTNVEEKSISAGDNIFNPEGELVIDVFETNSEFVVLAAIAGIKIQDLDISVEKDMMVIKGQRSNPDIGLEKRYFYQECYWGPFSKKIVLPENINTKAANAQIDKGILTVRIPRLDAGGMKEDNVKLS